MSLDKIVANGIGDLVAERDALAARVAELEEALRKADYFLSGAHVGMVPVKEAKQIAAQAVRAVLAKGGKS